MRIRVRYIVLFLFLAIAVMAAVKTVSALETAYRAPGPLAADKLVYLPPGETSRSIAEKLSDAGVIDGVWQFRALSKINRLNGDLKAGEYQFKARMAMADVIALMQSGKTYQHKLTVPEGLTSAEITALVNKAEAMTGTIVTPPAEGTLLPETYSYSYGEKRVTIMARMQKSMQDTLMGLWQQRVPDTLLKTPQEAVTLASVVEKETGIPAERPRIAGVFLNRLKINMPLQTDPTVIYALTRGAGKLDRTLGHDDLSVESPYNTYLHAGLPPGPIANPGRAALLAVLHPEANDYLYFVANGSGGHAFAKDIAEHNRNVTKWREIRAGQ